MLGRQYSSSVARMAGLQYNRRAFTAGMASLLTSPLCLDLAHAQQIERSSLKLGVGNRAHLYYLPVTIADRRGYFRDYGLTVTTSDFEGGGRRSMPCSPARSMSQQARTSIRCAHRPW